MANEQAEETRIAKQDHKAQRDLLAAHFRAHPYEVVTWETLEYLVGRNWQQRLSDARREEKMTIENLPRYADFAGRRKRITGNYRFRPHAEGRDADKIIKHADSHIGPLFDQPSGWQDR